jgi:Protein of unknown function (DUF1186)
MEHYDPLIPPNPQEWLALDEQERIMLVKEYHRSAGIRFPIVSTHAMVQTIVENQAALGDQTPVQRTLDRLMAEGLDRHDALHAIGSVLADLLYDTATEAAGAGIGDPNAKYFTEVEQLTAEEWRQSAPETAGAEMDAAKILDDFGSRDGLPVEAIHAARAQRPAIASVFLQLVERAAEGKAEAREEGALFIIFHLLGEWREKSAFRPLARLLRQPSELLDRLLGDAITETSHKVMASVYDGDPQPLYDIILDENADEFIRSRMCEALIILVRQNQLPRAEAARFLAACYSELQPQTECAAWTGWSIAIALLGLVELKPMVELAFKRSSIPAYVMSFKHFEADLQQAIAGSDPSFYTDEYTLFGNTIGELSRWAAFNPGRDQNDAPGDGYDLDDGEPRSPTVPAVNPFKDVGRNDPCPAAAARNSRNAA